MIGFKLLTMIRDTLMIRRLKPLLFKHLLVALLFLGLGVGWPLAGRVVARTIDIGHKEVSAVMFKNSTLKLVGTAVTLSPDRSIAVIEDLKNRRQWSFHEGDRAWDILIKAIRRDHIVIDAGNGEKTVKMRSFLATGTAPVRHISGPTATSINRTGSRERHVVLDRVVTEAAFSEPEAVLDRVDITSARLLNREVGFRIAAFDADSIFSKMGLRSGDLLLAINGREIAGPEEAKSLFETLREGGDIDLTVRRRARTYHINLLIQ